MLVSVPEPLGGALVFATNHFLYYNQNNRYGLLLNSVLDQEYKDLSFPLGKILFSKTHGISERSDVELLLDTAHCQFLTSERLLVSLKGGELYPIIFFEQLSLLIFLRYLFHLQADARNIQSVTITKAGASVLTSCVSFS
jgi:hypothetical protein